MHRKAMPKNQNAIGPAYRAALSIGRKSHLAARQGPPQQLGLCLCPLVRVRDTTIVVRALDAIDSTPVLDIKPWMQGFAPRGTIREPKWAREIMEEYW